MHAQGRLLYVHTLEVLGCTPPAITRHSSHRGVYLVMTYGGSPVTYGQSHTMECTHCPISPCLRPPQLKEVQSASCFTGTVDAKVEPDAPPPRRRPATSTSTVHDHYHDHDHGRAPRHRAHDHNHVAPEEYPPRWVHSGPRHRATWRTAETMEGGIAVPLIIGSSLSLSDVDNTSFTEVLPLWLTSWRERASGLSASEPSMNLEELTSVENPSALFT